MTDFPGGSARRRIAKYGESITLENDVISTDESSDWNDQTVATSSVTLDAVVQKQRTGIITRTEEGDEVEVDANIYVDADDLGSFTIRDGGEGGPTTTTINGVTYTVINSDNRPNGVVEIEVTRV